MKKNFLLAVLLSALSVGSSFSATTLQDTINNIKSDVVSLYNNINTQFNNVVPGWATGVSFAGSLQEYVATLGGAFNNINLTNLTNLDHLAPASTSQIRDLGFNTANEITNQLIKAIGYTLLDGSVGDWALIAAPVADAGNAMSAVTDNSGTWTISVNSHSYEVLASSLPATITTGSSISFTNATYGNLVFQLTGGNVASSALDTSLLTNTVSFVLPESIFEAAQGLAQLASDSTIALNKNSVGSDDPNFSLSAAQRLAAALNSAA